MVNGVNRSAHHHSHITMNQDNILCTFQAKEQERTQLVTATSQQQPPYHIQAIQSGTEKGKLNFFSNMCTHTDNVTVYTGTLKSNDVLTGLRCHQCEYIRSTLYAGKFVSVKRKAASHILHNMNAIKQFGDGYTNILSKESLDYTTHIPIPKFIDESSQWDHYYRLIKAGVARIDQAKSNEIVNTVQNHPKLNEIIMAYKASKEFRECLPMALIRSVLDRYVDGTSSNKKIDNDNVMHFELSSINLLVLIWHVHMYLDFHENLYFPLE